MAQGHSAAATASSGYKRTNRITPLADNAAQAKHNPDASTPNEWSKPLVPIFTGYGDLDIDLDPIADQGKTWLKAPLGAKQPTNFSRITLFNDGKGFVLGECGSLLRWVD